MSRTGKCTNVSDCVLAYRGEKVEAPEGEFLCPECGRPLTALEESGPAAKKAKPLPILGLLGIAAVVALCVVVFMVVRNLQRVGPAEKNPASEAAMAEVVSGSPVPSSTSTVPLPSNSGAEIPVARAKPVLPGETDPPSSASEAAAVPTEINLDPQAKQNAEVKTEVLKRIDLMPTISADNKDRLYVSVERARQMGKIVKIPFGFGQRSLSTGDVENLRIALGSDRIKSVLQDPTAVLVVLGYADAKGDEEKNLKISQDRAQGVVDTLRDKVGVLNVMHAVGMGSSTLFDESGNDKNRVVEVWVVLP